MLPTSIRDKYVLKNHSFKKLGKMSALASKYELPENGVWYKHSFEFLNNLIKNYKFNIKPSVATHWSYSLFDAVYNSNIILSSYDNFVKKAVQVNVNFEKNREESIKNVNLAIFMFTLLENKPNLITSPKGYFAVAPYYQSIITSCYSYMNKKLNRKMPNITYLGKYNKHGDLISIVLV